MILHIARHRSLVHSDTISTVVLYRFVMAAPHYLRTWPTVLHDNTNTSRSLRPPPTWLGPVEIGVCTYKWSKLRIQRNTRSATLSTFLGYVPHLLLLDGLISFESSRSSPCFPSWATLPCSSPQRLTQAQTLSIFQLVLSDSNRSGPSPWVFA